MNQLSVNIWNVEMVIENEIKQLTSDQVMAIYSH